MVERHQAVAPGPAALASLFHPDTPNDTAPGGYRDPSVPAG
jgi:hypothetical protein